MFLSWCYSNKEQELYGEQKRKRKILVLDKSKLFTITDERH